MPGVDRPFERNPIEERVSVALAQGWDDASHVWNLHTGYDGLNQAAEVYGLDEVSKSILNGVVEHLGSLGHTDEEAKGMAIGAAYMACARSRFDTPKPPRMFTA